MVEIIFSSKWKVKSTSNQIPLYSLLQYNLFYKNLNIIGLHIIRWEGNRIVHRIFHRNLVYPTIRYNIPFQRDTIIYK